MLFYDKIVIRKYGGISLMNKNRAKEYAKEALSLRLSLQNTKGLKSEGRLKDFPKSLFKYLCFNKFTIDSISNNYLYLSPAKKLDNQFECTANFDSSITYSNEIVKKYFVEEVTMGIFNVISLKIQVKPNRLSKE